MFEIQLTSGFKRSSTLVSKELGKKAKVVDRCKTCTYRDDIDDSKIVTVGDDFRGVLIIWGDTNTYRVFGSISHSVCHALWDEK